MKCTHLSAIRYMILRYPSRLALVFRQIKIVKASKINRFRLARIGRKNLFCQIFLNIKKTSKYTGLLGKRFWITAKNSSSKS